MPRSVRLFVLDTGPLITLAAAGALDTLLQVHADIVIPDAVLYEAMHDAAKLGAQDIIDWVKAHRTRIELAPTQAYAIFTAARAAMPTLKEPGLGERTASRAEKRTIHDEATNAALRDLLHDIP